MKLKEIKKETWFRIASVVLLVVMLILSSNATKDNPEAETTVYIVFSVIFGIVAFLSFFGKKIMKKFGDKKEEDKMIIMNEDEIQKMLNQVSFSKFNNIKQEGGIELIKTISGTQDQVRAYKIRMEGASQTTESYIAIINVTSPEFGITLLSEKILDGGDYQLNSHMNKKLKSPDKEPDKVITKVKKDEFGDVQKEVVETKHKSKEEKEKKKEEDVI